MYWTNIKTFCEKNKGLLIKALLLSVCMSIFFQLAWNSPDYNQYITSDTLTVGNISDSVGLEVSDNSYSVISNDPQMLFACDSVVSLIKIEFADQIKGRLPIQVYYPDEKNSFSEQNSVHAKISNQSEVIIKIPARQYTSIRIDIGDKAGQSFSLNKVLFSSAQISVLQEIFSRIQVSVFIILFVVFFGLSILAIMHKDRLAKIEEKKLCHTIVFFSFILFFLGALIQELNASPDENMRYDVIKYIYENHRLPHGGDPAIRSIWGLSYAFTPYLSGLVSVVFMKAVSVVSTDERVLIIAARMAVVLFGTLTVYFITKIGCKCFKSHLKWVFISLIVFWPQFVFLGCYMNNDMLALLSIAMILYYSILGAENNWDLKSKSGLGIGVSICLLSYYNAYSFVLVAVIFFLWSSFRSKMDKKKIGFNFLFVAGLVFLLCGWWFIRNGIIYNGDFLGMKTSTEYANLYAIDSLKPINRSTPLNTGTSLFEMLFEWGWLISTIKSFIGVFGGLSSYISGWMYLFYSLILLSGGLLALFNIFDKKRKYISVNHLVFFNLSLFAACIITVVLSIYNSYFNDYQAQGRYIMPILIPLMFFIAQGAENMICRISQGKYEKIFAGGFIFIYLCVFLVAYLRYFLPTYI